MLNTVRSYITDLSDKQFSEFYQDYVMQSQNRISEHRLAIDSHRFRSIDSISTITSGLNDMIEELKHL